MTKINAKHLIFFILGVSAISIRTYSSLFIRIGGRDTWISTLIASILFVAFFIFIIYVSIKTETFNLEKVYFKAIYKPIGIFFIALFILGLFLTSIEASIVESSSIHTNIFLETPIWYCLIFFIVPAAYVSTKNFKSISIVVMITVSIAIISDIIMFSLIYQYSNFDYVFPILFAGFSREIFLSILMVLGSLSSISILFPFLRHIVDKNNLVKDSLVATVIVSLIAIYTIFSLIGSFGPLRASNIFYPEFVQYQRLEINGFIECGDLFFILRTVSMMFLKYVLSLTAIITLLKSKIKHKRIFIIVYSLIVFLISLYIGQNQFFLFNLLNYYQFISLILFFVIPLLCYFIYFIRYKLNKTSKKLDNNYSN